MLNSKSILKAYCGHYHSVVLTDEGYVYSWGGSASHFMDDNIQDFMDIENIKIGQLE